MYMYIYGDFKVPGVSAVAHNTDCNPTLDTVTPRHHYYVFMLDQALCARNRCAV